MDVPEISDEEIEARVLEEVGEDRWQAFSEAARRHHRDKARRELVKARPASDTAAARSVSHGVHRERCPIHGVETDYDPKDPRDRPHFASGGEVSVPQMRRQVVADLHQLVEVAAGTPNNLIALSDYEVVNLLAALQACGYGLADARSPLNVLHNGDWLGQVVQKLQSLAVNYPAGPNLLPEQAVQAANRWPKPA
jgi:hypothetical protein